MNWLLHNLTSVDYSVVPVTGKVKLYAKAQRKIALGLEFKCSIASSVHTEPHSPFSFHPTLLSGYLLWKYSLSFGFSVYESLSVNIMF